MQFSSDNNHPFEELSIPIKITDCIFMGDEAIAHVPRPPLRTSSGSLSTKSPSHQLCRQTVSQQLSRQGYVLPHLRLGREPNPEHRRTKCGQRCRRLHRGGQAGAGHSSSPRLQELKQALLSPGHLPDGQVPSSLLRYHWNIYKALEYLNSRREGTEVDEVFILQLNTLHSRLLDRNLIKSKQWIITSDMQEE